MNARINRITLIPDNILLILIREARGRNGVGQLPRINKSKDAVDLLGELSIKSIG
jgi:hypothetical protein